MPYSTCERQGAVHLNTPLAEDIQQLEDQLALAMQRDRFRLRKQLRRLRADKSPARKSEQLLNWKVSAKHSIALRSKRNENAPTPKFDTELPIFDRKEEICQAIQDNQIVIISGETGSGKSTQLPLMALEMGYGASGLIGHTQPRRIAARGVAARIASQLGSPLGSEVGYKIRFADKTNDEKTYIKLMTDGILLAETQSDRFLDAYDLLIVDEAHERSLNIDFLLGYLRKILSRRKNLRLIITSATIDTAKFAEHFTVEPANPVPIINVQGRTYPVEIRYQPAHEGDVDGDVEAGVVEACRELTCKDDGDILVFLPTENDIRTLSKKLRAVNFVGRTTEILPLYARLSTDQQNRIFQSHKNRHIILATNVAESSITVPGIRCVVDTGTARISRYAPRSKVQRLPIESISQASANQRAGRCGRIGPGVCIRLFSEDDYRGRPEFTTPEIRRTNLASVILQTLSLKLGEITEFPFIDPPSAEAIRDGYKTLFEIGAVDERRRLTKLGRKLAKLPVDPRIGRMIFAADEEGCLNEILIIAAALEIQDPRIRPAEKKQAADAQHAKFANAKSDFFAFLNVWDFFEKQKENLSRSKLRKACEQNFLSYVLIRQWQDIHRQLKSMVAQSGLSWGDRKDDFNAIHRSLLTGLLSGVAMLSDKHEYTGAGGVKFHLWPGSGVFESKPKWIVVGEIVETTRRYGRTVGKIAPEWIEPIGGHLIKKHHSDPFWSRKQQSVLAHERVSLFGLPVIANRQVNFSRINPEQSRELFIEKGLATEGEFTGNLKFYQHNLSLLETIKAEAAKTRNRELVIDEYRIVQFYQQRLPENAVDLASLRKLIKSDPELDETLKMSRIDLLSEDELQDANLFPDDVQIGSMNVSVNYAFKPGAKDDGATIVLPIEGVGQIDETQAGWLIPGLMHSRIVSLIRSLPKPIRRKLVPAPETAQRVAERITFGSGSFLSAVANELSIISEEPIEPEDFQSDQIDPFLNVNIRVVDHEGEVLAEGRSLADIRSQLGPEHATNVVQVDDATWNQDGLREWIWRELPREVMIRRGATELAAFPAIVDQLDSIGLRLFDSKQAADQVSRQGLVRLFQIRHRKSLRSQVNWLPNFNEHAVKLSRVIPSAELKTQLADLITRIAFVDREKIPRDLASFEALNANAVERISVATQAVAKWLLKWATQAHAALLKLEGIGAQFSSAKGDIRAQIKGLTTRDFLSTTPWLWLEHYPRYFNAVAARIDKLPSTPPKQDQQAREELAKWWQKYEAAAEKHTSQAIVDPELTQFRWMIEEYRVSLFAQQLGTCITISAKRLEKQWKKIRQV